MNREPVYPVTKETSENALIDMNEYTAMYDESINDPEKFWGGKANEFLSWVNEWEEINTSNFKKGETKWF